MVGRGGCRSGWEGMSRSRLSDLELIKSWEAMVALDGLFSCDASLLTRLLDLRSDLLGWAM